MTPSGGISHLKPRPHSYHIAGNFRGPYISRIAIKVIFAETNFVDCMIKATPTQVAVKFRTWTPYLQGPVD